ncbi:N-methyltryptophan oxidase [compost metagenome]
MAGLYHAFGFAGGGFQLGPGVGEVMAELIAQGRSSTPIDAFRIDRFLQPASAGEASSPTPERKIA